MDFLKDKTEKQFLVLIVRIDYRKKESCVVTIAQEKNS